MQVLSQSVGSFDLKKFDLATFDLANFDLGSFNLPSLNLKNIGIGRSISATADVVDINHVNSFKPVISRAENPTNPRQNHLLATLSEAELRSFEADLELVHMSRNEILCESGDTPNYLYFPTTAVVSLQYLTEMGACSEVAVVGNDGVVGVSLFMPGTKAINQAQVHSEGLGYRLRAPVAKKLINNSTAMLAMLLRYSQAMFAQVAQTAVCNRHHSVDQQLSRRLLMSLDRLIGNDILMTQETIANMLGVRRESVTEAALKLQEAGAIKYSRGHITVLNRQLLENRSCECYTTDKKHTDRNQIGKSTQSRSVSCHT